MITIVNTLPSGSTWIRNNRKQKHSGGKVLCTPACQQTRQILNILCEALNFHAPSELTNLHHYAHHLPHRISCCQPSDPLSPTPSPPPYGIVFAARPPPFSTTHLRKSLPLAFRNKLKTHLFKAALTLDSHCSLKHRNPCLECMIYNLAVITHYLSRFCTPLFNVICEWLSSIMKHLRENDSPGHRFCCYDHFIK